METETSSAVTVKTEKSPVEGEIDKLSGMIGHAEERLGALTDRLISIMAVDPPSPDGSTDNSVNGYSPMYSSVANMANRVRLLGDGIDLLIRRLEI